MKRKTTGSVFCYSFGRFWTQSEAEWQRLQSFMAWCETLPEGKFLLHMLSRTGDLRTAELVYTLLTEGKICGTSTIKRTRRRTAEQLAVLKAVCVALVYRLQPVTVRQMFYQLVSLGMIQKTELEYRTVARLLLQLRRGRYLDYHMIADNTRWMRKPDSYDGLEQAIEDWLQSYRLNIWREQPAYVEIWCEKDALAGVLYEVTSRWDVPLMVTRGYASESFLHESAQYLLAQGKPAYLYYFGDYDPSGVDISRSTEERLRAFVGGALPLHFERVAVTPQQIRAWNLPTRPTKQSDARAKRFRDESVEVDAIPPDRLRQLVEECVLRHVDPEALRRLQAEEQLHRQTLGKIREAIPSW